MSTGKYWRGLQLNAKLYGKYIDLGFFKNQKLLVVLSVICYTPHIHENIYKNSTYKNKKEEFMTEFNAAAPVQRSADRHDEDPFAPVSIEQVLSDLAVSRREIEEGKGMDAEKALEQLGRKYGYL